ncbi:hypothetical protein UMM65_14600 [Aureibaculum sp. 2210JD6-5]|uniref:hypothetical protein n=1 Tax=Aureibaculum sp. 2210JD6-5 TaxID=3103957 RepID=UPI002AAE2B69|nr:hypothetical protein [Aureibaculum sp. 2210JD6-5]MDY7396478.1 hypothetical protein [Aureibaculum sp. 2210JD6-5]
MKRIALILLSCILFFSCNSSEEFNSKSACGVKNPVEDLAWLKNEIDEREQNDSVDWRYHYILQTSFKKQDIFIYGDCCPNCNSVYVVYNCSGENIGYIGDDKYSSDLLSKGTVIWKSSNNECDFSLN